MQDDLTYYKQRTVQISAKDPYGVLPQEQSLRSSLASFGDIRYFQSFCSKDLGSDTGPLNTAIVVFHNQASVKNTLESSRNESEESFWRMDSVKAHTLKKTGPLYNTYLTKIVPKLEQELHVSSSGSNAPPRSSENQPGPLGSEDGGPPLKRPRVESWGTVPDGSTSSSTSKLSQTPSTVPESTEWMRARIVQLEADLSAARAARDMSISEQNILRAAHEVEQRARREALLQKSAAEAALAQAEAEKNQFRSALEVALAVQAMQPNITGASDETMGEVKSLPPHSEETPGRVHDLYLEELQVELGTTELEDAQTTIQQLKAQVEQFKSELAATKEQLGSTQRSLEQKCASTLERYESTQDELKSYKSRLENERASLKKLKDALIPEVHKSLGATHETLRAFLSAMGEPSANELGRSRNEEFI